MVLAGLSAQLDHWKDSTLRKQDNWSPSVNRIWSTAPQNMEILAVWVDTWIKRLSEQTYKMSMWLYVLHVE